MEKDILARISEKERGFSKGQKRIAGYIRENYDKAAFMTAGRLGQTVGVSESTVVRFAGDLGYDGYPGMRRAIQEMIRSRLTSVQRIEVAKETLDKGHILENILLSDAEKLHATVLSCDKAAFNAAVDAIVSAKHLYIAGMRSSKCLAGFLGYYLKMLMENVTVIQDTDQSEVYEQIMRVREGDVFIGISYPRYSSRAAKAMRYAKDRGATAIGITDGENSPFFGLADVLLFAESDMLSFLDSLVAPMSLINALIVAVGSRNLDNVADTFQRLETIWVDSNVYERSGG